MYSIQFWHGQKLEWLGTGSGTFTDKSLARQRLNKMSEMTGHTVRFRIAEAIKI